MNQSQFRFRPATRTDVPTLLALIRELGEYEKLAHEIVATEETLAKSLFGGRQVAEAILCETIEGQAVAFALFFHNFSTFLGRPGLYLEDLFVRPAFRGNGIGEAMLRHLAGIARDRGCGRFEWSVLDWNRDAIRFYEKLGARPMSDWTGYRVTGPALEALAGKDPIT